LRTRQMAEQLSTEKQSVILDAARKRFAYYGFSKVTMDEIAADIGMGKASLYYYFPTKESLFEEVVKDEANQFFAGIETRLAEKVPACDLLRDYALRRVDHFRKLANLRALSFQQSKETRASFIGIYNDFQQREVKAIQEILRLGKKNAEFSFSDPKQAAESVIQMLYGPRAWLLKKIDKEFDDESYSKLERATKEIVEIILNGIKKRK